jgi:NAD(P)-dependent dehydrogenase (short-subunit alcohol dehydrogenase family)
MRRGLGTVFGKVAVVTGAASGIGKASALVLSALGARVALLDRDVLGLERATAGLAAGSFSSIEIELTRREEVERAADRVARELGGVDLVVNAAGIALLGGLLESEESDWQELLLVNVGATLLVTQVFGRAMLARGRGGHIVNVSSAAAFYTPSELVAYGATKCAVLGLSQGLDAELRRHGIGVSCVCPGFVDTPIIEHMRIVGPDAELRRERARSFQRGRGLTAERVAHAVVKAAERGAHVVPVGLEAHALYWFSRIAPKLLPSAFSFAERFAAPRGGPS